MLTTTLIINSVLLGVGLAMDAFSVSLANGLNEHEMGMGRMLGIAGTFAGFQFAMPMIGWVCVHAATQKFQAFQKYIPWIALALLLYIGGKMLLEGIHDNKKTKEIKAGEDDQIVGSAQTVQVDRAKIGTTEQTNLSIGAGVARTDCPDEACAGDGISYSSRNTTYPGTTNCADCREPESEHVKSVETTKRLAFGTLMVQGIATSIDALSVGFTISNYNTFEALAASLIIGIVTYGICMAGLALGKKFGTRLAGKASILGGVILIGIGIEIFVTGVF